MKYYYYVGYGGAIFDIGWTYDPVDFSDSEKIVKVFTEDTTEVKSWIEASTYNIYVNKQNFMKINNRRDYRIDEILN